jgi:8-oxo-dGTP pyrophosphatase MutT (NUDIX family)
MCRRFLPGSLSTTKIGAQIPYNTPYYTHNPFEENYLRYCFILEFEPHVTVATVVEQEARFLLVEEWADNRLVYNQPAGHLEASESLQQAAIRETLEETGWAVALRGIVGVSLYTAPANGVTYFRTTFAATALQHHNHPLDEGIERK